MTKVFLDTEFTGLHQQSTLISVGLAAGDNSVFYAELTDYRTDQLNDWLRAHVIPHLSGNLPQAATIPVSTQMYCQGTQKTVADALLRWLAQFGGPGSVEIWADVLAWDWVLFCELYGGAFGIPEQLHYIPRDLSTLLWTHNIPPDQERESLGSVPWYPTELKKAKHHALYDALLEKNIFENIC